MASTKPVQINQQRFVRLFKDTLVEDSKMRFCFHLGAGASRSSGIPTKNDLAVKWFEEIVEDLESSQLQRWIKKIGIGTKNVEHYYQQIVQKRFQFEPEMSMRMVQQQITLATPGLGYLILAQILEQTAHNLAITSNADQLLEDALFSTASTKAPLFYQQAYSAETFVQQTTRPMVCKLHNDLTASERLHSVSDTTSPSAHLVHPRPSEIDFLATVCKTFRSVFIGHNGNRPELMECLSQLSNTNRQSIFWCTLNAKKINPDVTQLLTEKDFIVEIEGFDQLMFQIINSFNSIDNLDTISLDYFKENYLLALAKDKAQHYKKLLYPYQDLSKVEHVGIFDEELEEQLEEKEVPQAIDNIDQLNDFMDSLEQSNYPKDDNKYKEALAKDPNSAINNIQYAIFLEDSCSNPIKAIDYFKRAIHLAPKNENIKALYAFLLSHHLQDYDEAETYYSNATAIAPDSVPINIMFGIFLHTIRKKFRAAEENFKAAFKSTENDIDYSEFMKEIRMDYQVTESNYKRVIEKVLLI